LDELKKHNFEGIRKKHYFEGILMFELDYNRILKKEE
jgi:hypothetical protein